MSTPITKYVQDALKTLLSDNRLGFNAKFASTAPSYKVQPVVINWSSDSLQFFPVGATPDDFEQSTPCKYPMVFLYSTRSQNLHRSKGRIFSGTVTTKLIFWYTHAAASVVKAGIELDNMLSVTEDVINQLTQDGNWPQLWGASNSVCRTPICTRGPLEKQGQAWRQPIAFEFEFTLDTN